MGRRTLNAKKIFFSNIKKLKNGCWKWTRTIHKITGYGRFKAENIEWSAHRFSYIFYKGEIPKRFHVHHICKNRWCVNYIHLEAISPAKHVMLGNTITAKNIKKKYCKNGHKFTEKNTYFRSRKNGGRDCRICRNKAVKRSYNKMHQALPPHH